jgi:hypothetical protein
MKKFSGRRVKMSYLSVVFLVTKIIFFSGLKLVSVLLKRFHLFVKYAKLHNGAGHGTAQGATEKRIGVK